MNPLIVKTVDKISKLIELDEAEKLFISLEIGNAIIEALYFAKENPNYNLNGGSDIDENTIGNSFTHVSPDFFEKFYNIYIK